MRQHLRAATGEKVDGDFFCQLNVNLDGAAVKSSYVAPLRLAAPTCAQCIAQLIRRDFSAGTRALFTPCLFAKAWPSEDSLALLVILT